MPCQEDHAFSRSPKNFFLFLKIYIYLWALPEVLMHVFSLSLCCEINCIYICAIEVDFLLNAGELKNSKFYAGSRRELSSVEFHEEMVNISMICYSICRICMVNNLKFLIEFCFSSSVF